MYLRHFSFLTYFIFNNTAPFVSLDLLSRAAASSNLRAFLKLEKRRGMEISHQGKLFTDINFERNPPAICIVIGILYELRAADITDRIIYKPSEQQTPKK